MNQSVAPQEPVQKLDSALCALASVAGYYRIAVDPGYLQRELVLNHRPAAEEDVVRAAQKCELRARVLRNITAKRLAIVPVPAIVKLREGGWVVLGGRNPSGSYRLWDPMIRMDREVPLEALLGEIEPFVVLVGRRIGGKGVDPASFSLMWFLPSIWRYRRPLAHVMLASLFVQMFALVTPLFFQVVMDKVLVHKAMSTLYVLVIGIVAIAAFDAVLQFLRTYALSHTTNRIDVELGQRLFRHLMRLPLGYFEMRAAGQTVARVRELENIRSFLTGQGLFAALDFLFTFVFIGVLLLYSWHLTLIVVLSIPVYLGIVALVRPRLRALVKQKFDRGAASQQFLVEAVVGIQAIKAAAVEPIMDAEWEERLSAYVHTTFEATLLSAGGQGAVGFVNKVSTALILMFGAMAVMQGELTVGGLVAFTMIANQTSQPIMRLSQIWQDFQQVKVSIDRLGDILNTPPERTAMAKSVLPPARGNIIFHNVSFRYRGNTPDVLRNLSLEIKAGEVIGIVGPSGSGKSTLTKLVQRLYLPVEGQVVLDGLDLAHADPSWLRRQIGVVLQDNILFNRTIHENIAFASPALQRAQVMAIARLAGADEFISRLPEGYDTMVEERGSNLSGGQRQRIAIARALATNPPIVIFDEATSALDYESERVIQTNMRQIVKNRTVLIIAHRLATVRTCDRIVGIEDGRIVEVGRHDELVARSGGLYSRLWALQNQEMAL